MATYFHSNSEIQTGADGLQTLILMNPGYVQYSDTPPPPPPHAGNLLFLNSNTSLPPQTIPHAQQFVGVPLSAASQDPPIQSHNEASALHGFIPRVNYNLWNTIDPNAAAREASRATQGLSLSLQSQVNGEEGRVSGGSPCSGVSNNGIQSVLLSSKYLKAAQELLDEVVSVNDEIKVELREKKRFEKNKSTAGSGDGGEGSVKRSSEISTTERQEIQMKKSKLITMLDEVEQRYRQYRNQMQIVICTFEQVAGIGSARTYTALALETISKQFRCLKDAITGQIRAANKSLGEEDKIEGGSSRLKYVDHHLRQQRAIQQLGMINHNAWRPQRGLPERSVSVLRAWLFEHFLHPYPKDSDKHMLAKQTGLTRSQVSNWFINARVRLWKPMVEEMYMEEMKEHELNGSEDKSSKNGEDPVMKPVSSETESKSFNSKQDLSKNHNTPTMSIPTPSSTSPVGGNIRNQTGFSFIGSSSELDGITQGSPKKQRNNHEILIYNNNMDDDVKPNNVGANNEELSMKFLGDHHERQSRDGYSFMGNQTNFINGGFGHYPMEEIGRFGTEQFTAPRFSGNNNGVSLTLGLPQSFLPNQNIQVGRRLDMSEPNDQFGAISTSNSPAFESINLQNPKRFVAQLLPDFVA